MDGDGEALPAETNDAGESVDADEPSSSGAVEALFTFATGLQLWQQEIIRRIAVKGELNDSDIDDIFEIVLAGVDDGGDQPVIQPLMRADLPPGESKGPKVALRSVRAIDAVNKLAAGQVLPFATSGLTVVYGENGSGKSGFCRVLKEACSAQGHREPVIPNVFEETNGQPSAEIQYSLGSDELSYTWRQGEASPSALSAVVVFDARRAPLYADEERRLEYLPAGLDILPKLGRSMLAIRDRVVERIAATRRALHPIELAAPSGGDVDRLLSRLQEGQTLPSAEEIEHLAVFGAEAEVRLIEVRALLEGDPAIESGRLDGLASALENLVGQFRAADEMLTDTTAAELLTLRERVVAARDASRMAATDMLLPDSLIPNVGSESWRLMFQYAMDFARLAQPAEAYPGEWLGRCPLCQQVLDEEAGLRLRHFREYVEGVAERTAQRLEAELISRVSQVATVALPSESELAGISLGSVGPDARLRDLMATAEIKRADLAYRQSALITGDPARDRADDARVDVEALGTITAELLATAVQTRVRANEIRNAADPTLRKQIELERDELQARQQVRAERSHLQERLVLLTLISSLEKAIATCDTTAISVKNSKLRNTFLTAAVQRHFEAELLALGLDELPLKLKGRSERGDSLVSVALKATTSAPNRDVLSEGELRALSLAGFFADLTQACATCVVLDDPASSLDHARIEKLAARTVTQAAGCQVVVFTHSVTFFHELWAHARDGQVPFLGNWVSVDRSLGTGIVAAGEHPWRVRNVAQRLNLLDKELAEIRSMTNQAGYEYEGRVELFYARLRETWERLVEELLFYEVVGRFQQEVKTLRLENVEVTDDDFVRITNGMTRTSRFSGHDTAVGVHLATPAPVDLRADVDAIRDYVKILKDRSKLTKDRRQRYKAPPDGAMPPTVTGQVPSECTVPKSPSSTQPTGHGGVNSGGDNTDQGGSDQKQLRVATAVGGRSDGDGVPGTRRQDSTEHDAGVRLRGMRAAAVPVQGAVRGGVEPVSEPDAPGYPDGQ